MERAILPSQKPAIFLDRDGVLNENRPNYVRSYSEVAFLSNAFGALAKLALSEFVIVMVTNQSAIGRNLVSREMVDTINDKIVREFEQRGGRIDAVYLCPHHPDAHCACRKPAPGMLLQAATDLGIDLSRSFLIGDAVSDIEAAYCAGVKGLLVMTGRGESQQSLLQAKDFHCPVVQNLASATDWVLRNREVCTGKWYGRNSQ